MELSVSELQHLTQRERLQGRLNLRAARMADPVEAIVYGLNITDLTSSLPGGATDDDGNGILVKKTGGGNWSSDGNDTAPVVGPWLFLERVETSETVDGELSEVEEESGEPFPSVTQDVVQWLVTLWDDGAQDVLFDWRSEQIQLDLAEDLFSFRYWNQFPDTENTYLEDDAVPSTATLWIQPLEPAAVSAIADVPGLQTALDERLKLVAVTPVTDAAMNAAGIFEQMEVSISGSSFFIPFNSSAWP